MKDLKTRLEKGQVVIGTDLTMKNLRLGKIEKVLITKNCPTEVKEEILRFSDEVKIEQLDKTNTELGIICKKPYAISVIGYLKEK
ncbi:ribosomal L7Ae/L30e/S12e/Gadd45 family protein [Candidatus Woesearchaeota archaeon]|nr:ribosomal L7Ae/L30e/S12e/Gadd45 family protein [Candidatus Woesearchaeota archaeon]MBW3017905.1 ribosomal L7Ae/L30e/S12e/Gadd45 family protein [Candidatus Woesearchaeota archaeon]